MNQRNGNTDWQKVGVIGVDAGICWIGDPCYILHRKDGERENREALGADWLEFCGKLDTKVTQFRYPWGGAGLGVVVSTGYGDGTYDVLARCNSEGRIAEVKVVFIEEAKG